MIKLTKYVCSIIVIGTMSACTMTTGNQQSLYDELGGKAGIDQLTEELLWAISDDERIFDRFVDADLSRFQEKFSEQICYISGGPCEYTGVSMERAHGGQLISSGDFHAVVENLYAAMEQVELPISTQNRLLRLLAPMHYGIVER